MVKLLCLLLLWLGYFKTKLISWIYEMIIFEARIYVLIFREIGKGLYSFSLVVASFGHDDIKPLSGAERV